MIGIDRPLAEGPEMSTEPARDKQYQRVDWANADTTDEETELPGTVRPRKGDGWWGRGPPISIHHKGEP